MLLKYYFVPLYVCLVFHHTGLQVANTTYLFILND